MPIQEDETLQMYLEESLEHLNDIENDILAIENDGADINEDLVNKVYRAAHSIKGGAGFMGLTNIKDLTHEMENILGKIRSREMIPVSGNINPLLKAADKLKELLDDVLNSNEIDIDSHVQELQTVLKNEIKTKQQVSEESAPADKQEYIETSEPRQSQVATGKADVPGAQHDTLALTFPGENEVLNITFDQITPYFKQSKHIYFVKIRINEDVLSQEKTFQSILEEMEQTGSIISTNISLPDSSDMDAHWTPDTRTAFFLFCTILKPTDISILFEVTEDQILELRKDHSLYFLNGDFVDTSNLPVSEPAPSAQQITQNQIPLETNLEPVEFEEITQPPEMTFQEETSPQMNIAMTNQVDQQTSLSISSQDKSADKSAGKKQAKFEHETSLRVHVSLLDQLMTLAGELVLSRNQLLQSMSSNDLRGSEIAGQRIDLITSELQEAIMLTRMQSIGNVFNKFPRVVRDMSQTMGKKVDLVLEGKEVELDKTIIEAIGDPLTHLVRNSVDHGIELPQVRQKAGKTPEGQIFLKAYHEAGQVNIEITDDGKGLDGNVLANKAIDKGLITEDQAKVMSSREKINLIFLPGFSTAEKITDVSGRGVGMDVVKTNLDQLGGIIDIDSELGKGSTFRIKLPLTLAIIPCQIILTGGERYAIPQVNLEELLRIPADQVRTRIERVGDADVVRLRGNLLPLIRLSDVIGVESLYFDIESGDCKKNRRNALTDRRSKKSPMAPPEEDLSTVPDEPINSEDRNTVQDRRYHSASALNIVVVSTGTMKYGLVVDDLQDSEEIVVKPLGRDLKKCKGYAGATIMGDGRVALILDVSNLAHMAGLISMENTVRAAEVAQDEKLAVRAKHDRQAMLLFRSAEDEQFSAPLNLVERIEKIKRSDIENVGGKRVIKYRGGSLPLFSIDEVADVKPLTDSDNLLVIVFKVTGREVGLLAMGPVDALDTGIEIDGSTLKQTGIMGSTIIDNNTTLMVDIHEIVKISNPQWFEEKPEEKQIKTETTILFAEDSTFFRNQVKGSIEQEGFTVLEAEDGVVAWDLLQEHADQISLVVTDIEMPNMDGFTLTTKIKQSPLFAHLPVIALTTLAGEEDIAKGKNAGIDDYQIKLDREKLMKSIINFLKAA
ncbi:MAG: response regulator [Desulfobacteraceae bacterium]|nr:response regulator [Desulfobacteraceae bacterium]